MRVGGREPYPEQSIIATYMREAQKDEIIALIEAPTGTGKTANIAWAALERAQSGVALVAVPSIALAFQTEQAVQAFITRTPEAFRKVVTQIVLGRPEFIDHQLILAAFDKPDQKEIRAEIESWINVDAPGAEKSHPTWTKHGLRAFLATKGHHPDLPENISIASTDKASDAAQSYLSQFGHHANLYIATHAMLANDLQARFFAARRWASENGEASQHKHQTPAERWADEHALRLEAEIDGIGRFAPVDHLIVDEAHQLDENLANAFATGISLTSLIFALQLGVESKAIPASVLQAAIRVRQDLTNLLSATTNQQSLLVNWNKPQERQTAMVGELVTALGHISRKKLVKVEDRARWQIERAMRGLTDGQRYTNHLNTHVSGSPTMRYPTIHVGRRSLLSEKRFLWDTLRSAVMISATIYTPLKSGPSSQHLVSSLALGKTVRQYPPIAGDWLYKNVIIHVPSIDRRNLLTPPKSGKREQDRQCWLKNVAQVIIEAEAEPARSLVLATSLHTSEQIARDLEDALPSQIVIDGSRRTLAENKATFLRIAGDRPVIWVAQGPAWTGLDIPNPLLDRLYITRLPMPMPAPGTEEKTGQDYAENLIKMKLQLRQGFGRLVRSREALRKEIWLLDGRWADTNFGVEQLLSRYERRVF